jgi:hypothetical protein
VIGDGFGDFLDVIGVEHFDADGEVAAVVRSLENCGKLSGKLGSENNFDHVEANDWRVLW